MQGPPTWPAVVLGYEAGVVVPRFEVRVGDAAAHVRHVGGHASHHKPAARQYSTGCVTQDQEGGCGDTRPVAEPALV